jgi:predicted Zn-dependent protease
MRLRLALATLIFLAALAGCSVNPVTGERNFQLYDQAWETQVGTQMYAPMKQSQGGEFILDPELTAYVQEVGSRLAAQARRKDVFDFEFSILNDSVPNAWALPGGKIVVNRGLLVELESEAELAAVLGHEIVHADAAHGARAQSKGALTQAGAMISMVILGSTIRDESAREVAMMVPAMGAQMITQKYGRDAERESDEYGMQYMSEAGYDPQGAVELQKTFVRLSEGRNEDWLTGLFASHPPSNERVRNNEKTARKLPSGGESGRDRYQSKIAYLKRLQPAYEAYDQANKALSEDDPAKAQELLHKALAMEPREALFHDLQGDLHALDEDHEQALASYRRAIEANEGFFYSHLRRGQIEFTLENWPQSRTSLDRSLELMPTAEAHYLLGLMDRDAGQTRSAVEHFQAAASSDTETGRKATNELVILDLPNNPSRYIASRAAVDRDLQVWAQFGNRTGVAVRDIEISWVWLDDNGQTRSSSVLYPGPLAGESQDQVRLGIRLNSAAELDRRVRVEISDAKIAD